MIYEQSYDRENQRRIMKIIWQHFAALDYSETPEFEGFDFEVYALGRRYLFEIKKRNISISDFKTIFVSKRKYDIARGLPNSVDAYYCVEYNDAYAVWDMKRSSLERLGARSQPRTDRPEDDPVVEFPVSEAIITGAL